MKMIVFSLDTSERQPDKAEYDTMKNHMLTSLMGVTNARGVYKGREESSFICTVEQEIQEKMIMGIAHAYKQEAILEVELPSRKGYLRFVDGKPREYVGIWKEAGLDAQDNFTINLDNMKVYKCYPEVIDKSVSV